MYHAILDYLFALLLMTMPWQLHFTNEMAVCVAFLFGVITIAMSLMTDYEGSIVKWIPLKTHLLLDINFGLVLLATPWLFRFEELSLSFVCFGLASVIVAICSCPTPLFSFVKRNGYNQKVNN